MSRHPFPPKSSFIRRGRRHVGSICGTDKSGFLPSVSVSENELNYPGADPLFWCKWFNQNMGVPPTASMGYYETGAVPGGTVLSDADINNMANTCKSPGGIIVLNRAFWEDNWKWATQRALKNPHAAGAALEYQMEKWMESNRCS